MKKKTRNIIIGVVITILLILLFPIRMVLKDGGSIVYKSLVYEVTIYHKLIHSDKEYSEGVGIKIFGMEVYNSSKVKKDEKKDTSNSNTEMNLVLSLEDKIEDNTAWCGTFNLIWNDLKNDLAKQDIVFTPQLKIVENLNKGTFNTSELSEDSYYKVYGTPSLKLKKKIEKEIKRKFNETSDILDEFDWDNRNTKDYFLYTMLKKEFEFSNVFTKLPNGSFGESYNNVKYFGIDDKTEGAVREQVEVLYYNSDNDFAIKLNTKGKDEVIITKGNNKETFSDIYKDIEGQSGKYQGNKHIKKGEIVKIPYITFNIKEEIKEIENKPFTFSNSETYSIEKALQTIKFELNEKGGKVKSEAAKMANFEAAIESFNLREFLIDDTFTIFLKEKGKTLPYFASKISDISQVQNDVEKLIPHSPNMKIENRSFLATVLEETSKYMIVEPKSNEEIRKIADKIKINYGSEHYDYLYGKGRKVIINYTGDIIDGDIKEINTDNILLDGYEDFELSITKSENVKVKRILNNKDLDKRYNSDYSLYYYGIDKVNVKIKDINKEMPLEEALKEGYVTLDGIIIKANKDFPNAISYDDGGSIEYHYNDYAIIKKHKLDGNRDVYIGIPSMTLNKIDK